MALGWVLALIASIKKPNTVFGFLSNLWFVYLINKFPCLNYIGVCLVLHWFCPFWKTFDLEAGVFAK